MLSTAFRHISIRGVRDLITLKDNRVVHCRDKGNSHQLCEVDVVSH